MNHRAKPFSYFLIMAHLLAAVCVARAQSADGGMAPTAPNGQPVPVQSSVHIQEVLRGPDVPTRADRTLVRFNAKGDFLKVEGRPETAALAQMDLDADVREAARQALTDRRAALGVHMVQRYEQAVLFWDADKSGERDQASQLVRELRASFEAEVDPTPLMPPLARVLTLEQFVELDRLVNEYWEAWVRWEMRYKKNQSPEECRRMQERLAVSLFQTEAKSVYEETIGVYRTKLDRLLKEIDPTPTQRESVRGIVVTYLKATRTRPTTDQRKAVMGEIYRTLDDDRRVRLFELVVTDAANGVW